ncbi:unnamed protein product, partial [Rotaria socialis]
MGFLDTDLQAAPWYWIQSDLMLDFNGIQLGAPIPIRVHSIPGIGRHWLELVWNWSELELELVGVGLELVWNWSELELELVGIGLELVGIGWDWNYSGIGLELVHNWFRIGLELVHNWFRIGLKP